MSDIYKVNVTWTSPLIEYAPSGSWQAAISFKNDSTASYSFYGNGFKWFGAANASTYSIQLDGQTISAQPRIYQPATEGPPSLYCNATLSWGCVVLAEAYNLSGTVEHTVKLRTSFGRNATGNSVNLLAAQTLYNTTFPSRTIVQMNQVQMDDSRLVYAGDWKNIAYDPLVYRVSRTVGSTISFQFKGYSVQLAGATDLYQSTFAVSLDGRSQNVSLPTSGTPDPNCLLWYAADLDQTMQHTVVVTNTGTSGLVIKGISFAQLVDPENPGDPGDDTLAPSQGLRPGAIAGIVIGIIVLIGALSVAWILYVRIRHHRAVKVGGSTSNHNNSNAASTTSTLLSLRPLLGRSRSRSTNRISPWSEGPLTPDLPSSAPATASTVTVSPPPGLHFPSNTKQAHLAVPSPTPLYAEQQRLQSRLSDEPSSSRSQPRATPLRIQQQQQQEAVTPTPRTPSTPTSAAVPDILIAREQRKPPLHPPPPDTAAVQLRTPTSPSSIDSVVSGGETGSSLQFQPIHATSEQTHSDSHSPLSLSSSADRGHQGDNAEEGEGPSGSGGGGGGLRPATPPPAYEPEAAGASTEERRAQRLLQRTISKAIEERFHVVQ